MRIEPILSFEKPDREKMLGIIIGIGNNNEYFWDFGIAISLIWFYITIGFEVHKE